MISTVRKNVADLPYSLHDMGVTGFNACADKLIMEFENGFVKISNPCEQIGGYICFDKVDWDFSYAYILDFCGNSGPLTGNKLSLREFILQFENMNFEITDESYGYNRSVFSGYLSSANKLGECTVEIYHIGDMRYITEK